MRKIAELIDTDQYIIPKGIKKRYVKKVTVESDGIIKMNATFANTTDERKFTVAICKDATSILFVPDCDEAITFNKAGSTKDVDAVKHFSKKKLPFPLVYNMEWDNARQMWIGKIDKESHI